MSSLLQARAEYLAALGTIPNVHVSVHGGTFTQKELERYSKHAPHVVLTLLAFEPSWGSPVTAVAQWGVMVFTKAEPGTKQDASCIALAEAVCQALLPIFAGEEATSRPDDVIARNVYSTPLDNLGIAMWAIEWKNTLDLVQTISPDLWNELHATWDLQPRDDGSEIFEAPEAEDVVKLNA